MPRLFHAGFDVNTPAQLQASGLWDLIGSGILSTTGRTGQGLTGTSGATQAQNTIRTRAINHGTFTSLFTPVSGYYGFALKPTSLPASEQKVWALLDGSNTVLITLTVATDGKAKVYRGTFESGTLIGTSATAFTAAAAYRYLQVGFDFGTGNTVEVRSTLTTAGVPTTKVLICTAGLSSPSAWMRAEWYLTDTLILDDVYVNDGTTPFSGDTSIVSVLPASVTTHTYYFPWTPNSGSDLVTQVDDTTDDDDATYNYTRESYSTIRYQMGAITDDGRAVDDVQIVALLRAVSSTWEPGTGVAVLLWNGIGLLRSWEIPATMTTAYLAHTIVTKAAGLLGGNNWTIARVNASRFGLMS